MFNRFNPDGQQAADLAARSVKGSGVQALVKFAREQGGERAFQRILEKIPEQDREILSGTIFPTMRFSETTNQALINGIVETVLGGNPERAVEIGEFLIQDGLNLLYKMLYKVGNPSWIISNAGLLWKQYHDIGSLDVIEVSPGQCRIRLEFPFLDLAFCRVIVGCAIRSLELSGAKQVSVEHASCIAKGDPHCIYIINWS